MTDSAAPTAGALRPAGHVLPVRVYYEDTDAAGVVYYANYLRFMERGRSDMLRLQGIRHAELGADADGARLMFAVRRCDVEYIRPARLDDALEVHTRILECGGASLTMSQIVRRDGADLVRGLVRIGCVNANGKPRRFPASLRKAMAAVLAIQDQT